MALITKDYFIGELNIPDTDKDEVLERVNLFIAKYEEDLLRKLLGNALYLSYKTAMLTANPDQKWKDIRDGKDYTDLSGCSRYWMGLRKQATKQSLIANYVYYWFSRDRVTASTAFGEVMMKAEGGDKVSPATKQARAWNEMVNWAHDLFHFLSANQDAYPDWLKINRYEWCQIFQHINALNI
jgi:hypothetical protein